MLQFWPQKKKELLLMFLNYSSNMIEYCQWFIQWNKGDKASVDVNQSPIH